VSADGKTATGTDPPGGAIGGADAVDFMKVDFETRIHLNFEVPSEVKIKKKEGSAVPYDVLIGVLEDPQPFTLDSGAWKVRILQEKKADGSVDVSQPDTYAGPPPPAASSGGDGCFIATAAHGSDMAPDVQFLRQIRDGVLRQTGWGREFFDNYWKYYYRISPAIADEMHRDPHLRRIVRWSIVDPWTYYLKLVVSRPDWDQIDINGLEPPLRDFLVQLRQDMETWLSAIEIPTTFTALDPVEAVKELNVALGLVRRTGGLRYLDELVETGELPLSYAPEAEAMLLDLLRAAGRTSEEIERILIGNREPRQP
jgi:hypothetical protein